MTNDELIAHAASVLNPQAGPGDRLFGDVGAALVSEKGDLYIGVCIENLVELLGMKPPPARCATSPWRASPWGRNWTA